jgi:hypothetical protein
VRFKAGDIPPTTSGTASNISFASEELLSTGEQAYIYVDTVLGFLALLTLGVFTFITEEQEARETGLFRWRASLTATEQNYTMRLLRQESHLRRRITCFMR